LEEFAQTRRSTRPRRTRWVASPWDHYL